MPQIMMLHCKIRFPIVSCNIDELCDDISCLYTQPIRVESNNPFFIDIFVNHYILLFDADGGEVKVSAHIQTKLVTR